MENAFTPEANRNPLAELYREKLREHLRSGLPGVIFGLVLVVIVDIVLTVFALKNGGVNILEYIAIMALFNIIGPVETGLMFAGIPYGWKMISRVLDRFAGRYIVVIDILIYLFLLILKLWAAVLIGVCFYPIVLAYYFIRSRHTKQKVRMWAAIMIGAVLLLGVLIGICTNLNAKFNAAEADETVAAVVQKVEAGSFENQEVLLNQMSQNALAATKEEETDRITSYGWEITKDSQIHGVFFMEAKDPDDRHYINRRLSLSNAVAVVTGYYLVEAGPISVNQWEMDVTIYPNFSFDETQVLTYDTENVYDHALRSDDMEDLMEWFCGEYSDMDITEIPHP